jgi:catechol 2,3-dioxygenase-like lactoylglutathione lyase family enzyme
MTTAAPGIRGVHHSAFRCRDAEETRRFYEDVLGLPLKAALTFEKDPAGRLCRYYGAALHTPLTTSRSPGPKVTSGGTGPRRPSSKSSASGAAAQRTRPACGPRRWCQAQSVVRLASSSPPPAERKTMWWS